MDGFSYYNIFDTKGMEYLIIIAFLILLVPFSVILNRKVKLKQTFHRALGKLTAGILQIPQGIFYSNNHTWAHLAKSGIASVGLDDFLMHITGDVSINFLKAPGDRIAKGEAMAELQHDGKHLTVFSPLSGEVTRTNQALTETPGQLLDNPYDEGWIYRIQPVNWKEETGSYFLAQSATDWTRHELERFKDFLAVSWPKYTPEASLVALQDGGELRDCLLPELPDGVWADFQSEFLSAKEG
ncbi:MAG: glycine cleavage system protein H [Bacteroidales bacterium]|nr:glycine cleavage system protein H [Bacteroidales bacterium]